MTKIKSISAIEILDSRGDPTVQSTVALDNGITATASAPSGASVGSYEAITLRDRDLRRFAGLGVLQAIQNVKNIIAPKLIGIEVTEQQKIDKIIIELDGTQNKSRLGTNATTSVSMAVAKAGALALGLPLFLYLRKILGKDTSLLKIPTPAFNIINGGAHASNNIDFQEFLIIPASSKTYSEALEIGTNIYRLLKKNLETQKYSTLVGDEGGYSPGIQTNKEALVLIKQTISSTIFKLGFDLFLGLDIAANNIYKDQKYHLKERPTLSPQEYIAYLNELNNENNFLYMEDPLWEDEWDGWQKLTLESTRTIIVGDDLIATNPYRLQLALNKKAITGVVVKPNQIGTISEALAVVEMAKLSNLKVIVSHRSGETTDDFIADFAVAAGADYVKFGAPARGERVVKYNRLLEIEQILANPQKQDA